jgi:polyhydroxyalkanoate synthesis regulator phasin
MTIVTVEAAEVAADMNEAEARQVVDDIKRGINTVRARIYELDRRKGWKALGYRSFTACCMAEFPELHERTIRRQLYAAQVEDALKQELGPEGPKSIGSIPEKHLRPLVSVKNDEETLVAAYEKAQEIANEENKGKLTEAIVTRAVEEVKPEYEWSQSELERKAIAEAGGTVVANMHQDSDRALLHWAKLLAALPALIEIAIGAIHLKCPLTAIAIPFAIPTKFSFDASLACMTRLNN